MMYNPLYQKPIQLCFFTCNGQKFPQCFLKDYLLGYNPKFDLIKIFNLLCMLAIG